MRRWFCSVIRIAAGFFAQCLGVLASIALSSSSASGTIFWWTKGAVAIAAMAHTPESRWPERVAHVVSGMAAYALIRHDKFSVPVLIAVCASNGLGEVLAHLSVRHFYFPSLSATHVSTRRFLGIFLAFPVVLATLLASVPGTLAFYAWGGESVDISSVAISYVAGHICGTTTLLYPLLVVPILWRSSRWSTRNLSRCLLSVTAVTCACSFTDYRTLGFSAIVGVYTLFIAVSAYTDQCLSSLTQLIMTCGILSLTAAGRGPFVYVIGYRGVDEVFLGTQLSTSALTVIGAFTSISVCQVRTLRSTEAGSRRRYEELAEQQMVDLFRIVHDMRNNSTLIQAVCELDADAERDTNVNISTAQKVEIIKAINILNDVMVCDMVELIKPAKSEETKSVRLITRENVDVVEVMKIYLMVAKGLLLMEGKHKRVSVHDNFGERVEEEKGGVTVYTNRERLHQVVANLVSNAVKYTEKGSIVLGIRANSEAYLEIDVADSGIGMSDADVASVFDLFYRSKRASEVSSGAGLGLYNVRKTCDAIGANIRVSSFGEGNGSTFTLVLPKARDGEGDRLRDLRGGSRELVHLRVLVMDDSLVIRKLLRKYLTSFGCNVVDVASAEEARLRTTETDFDAVIADNSMGVGESGSDFIESVRNGRVDGLTASVPCIICSGNQFHDEETKTDSRTLAVTKPFSAEDILLSLKKLIICENKNVSSQDDKV